jgi:hypothetical protein
VKHASGKGWIGVDFDRTLAHYENWEKNGNSLGHPIPLMLERVKRWLAAGQEVRIFTARASQSSERREEDIVLIKAWCLAHVGQELEVTAEKDFNMHALWDDRAVSVMPNEGYANSEHHESDPLTLTEELRLWKRQEDNYE